MIYDDETVYCAAYGDPQDGEYYVVAVDHEGKIVRAASGPSIELGKRNIMKKLSDMGEERKMPVRSVWFDDEALLPQLKEDD